MMTDSRRIELSSVKPSDENLKVRKKLKTIRLVLSLGESNSTSCPEYSYADLIKDENQWNGMSVDPFGDEEDAQHREVAAIAQRFEAKYGTKAFKSGKKIQTQDMDDYYDVGDGYDEDDPFIDNTEAYDEVVPSTLTTKYGGFYINQGKLDFKSISDDSNDAFPVEKEKKKHKRKIIESDSEEETGETLAKKFKAMKRKKLLEGREAEKKKKKLGISMNGDISIKKKKKKKLKLSSRDEIPLKDTSVAPLKTVTSVNIKTTTSAVVTTATVTTNLTAVTMSTTVTPSTGVSINGQSQAMDKTGSPEVTVVKDTSIGTSIVVIKDDSSSKSGDDEKKMETPIEMKNTQLPSNLPSKLLDDIAKIKDLAKNNTEGKSKFFSGTTNKLLLTIENESLKLSKGHRSAVFNYLSEHLPSGKHALLRRAKKLRQSGDQLKEPIDKLREAIRLMMPKMIEDHNSAIAKAKLDAKSNGADAATEDGATESDEEEGKVDAKKPRMPRRKFSWNPEIIELLMKVVQVKMHIFNTFKASQQAPDEYLKTFLDSEIKSLWPSGWMNTRALLKITREENAKSGKPKKNVSGKTSPVPVMESANPTQHISKMDDVIEISSIIDDDMEEKSVVINLPGSEVKSSTAMSVNSQSRSSLSTFMTSNMQMGNLKPESNPIPSKTGVNNIPSVTVRLPDKTAKIGNITSFPRNAQPAPTVIDMESPAKSTSMKHDTFISTPIPKAASTPILAGSSASSSSTPVNSRSFLQALDPPSLHKEGSLPSKPQVSLLSPQQQQHKSSSTSNNLFQQQQQQHKKLQQLSQVKNTVQPKPGSSNLQQKLTQEPKSTSMKHDTFISTPIPKAASTPLVHLKNTSLPVGVIKDIHPVVSVNRIPTTGMAAPKQSTPLSTGKSIYSQATTKSLFVNRPPQATVPFSLSQTQSIVSKKKQLLTGPLQSHTISSSFTQSNSQNKKPGTGNLPTISLLSNSAELSKQYSPKQSSSQPVVNTNSNNLLLFKKSTPGMKPSLPGSQVKSGIVLGTSLPKLPKLKPHSDQQVQRHLLQQHSQPKSGMGASLTSPPKPLSVQTSLMSSSANRSISPSNKIIQSSPSSLMSLSRNSTPSPQKSPASPGNTASSIFDRIQSQILNQEATQEQGLKVLAMAMKIEESAAPKLGQGKSQDSPGKW